MDEAEVETEARAASGDVILCVGEVIDEKDEEDDDCECVGGLPAVEGRVGGSERGDTVVT